MFLFLPLLLNVRIQTSLQKLEMFTLQHGGILNKQCTN